MILGDDTNAEQRQALETEANRTRSHLLHTIAELEHHGKRTVIDFIVVACVGAVFVVSTMIVGSIVAKWRG
jgi:hypothetical protein